MSIHQIFKCTYTWVQNVENWYKIIHKKKRNCTFLRPLSVIKTSTHQNLQAHFHTSAKCWYWFTVHALTFLCIAWQIKWLYKYQCCQEKIFMFSHFCREFVSPLFYQWWASLVQRFSITFYDGPRKGEQNKEWD